MSEHTIPTDDTQTIESTQTSEGTPEVTLPSDEEKFEMPEKFQGKSADEIAKAYLELEKMKSKQDDTTKETESEGDTKEDDPKKEKEDDTHETVETLIEKYVDRGTDLTDDDYADLEAKGYSRKQVDIYKAGVMAQRAAEAQATIEKAGTTQDELTNAATWARENWSEDRINQFNDTISKADEGTQIQMIQMLTETFKASGTKTSDDGDPIHSGNKPAAQNKGYSSMEEMVADMRDPRYDQSSFSYDPAYYKAVRDKAGRSNF
jgi:uncharacterized protein Smg (DUF494 family)